MRIFEYRFTPWDSASFGFKTAEIIYIDTSKSYEDIKQKYFILEKELKLNGVDFIYTRISSKDFKIRFVIQQLGFYFVECSQIVSKSRVQGFTKQKFPKIQLETIRKSEIDFVKNIVRESFNFSRFHEDSNIPEELSRKRYYNWIDDLIKQNALIQVGKVGNKIVGINIQKVNFETLKSELILAGCSAGNELYVLSLWNEILSYNKELGILKIKTLISTSNIGVANVYSYYGFKVEQTLFGFHKKLL
jgi:hypothetical protein